MIGNPYKSEPTEDEIYYLALMRYIHTDEQRKRRIIKITEEIMPERTETRPKSGKDNILTLLRNGDFTIGDWK